ncbi:oxygenase MpaB family protein [Streptomyces sp. G-G2]|uniref:oxygenase MpaB family protein n=1 Tax=Streptomyces sp. G-G2 TaxID=3046201 RepID=UPI0024B98B35|nr:oxygenase MpaB family protein [Streptomyces sp. G-G2]MDJ0381096.1 oxygenase MpaB family protein [Streptomyces sp. G-G2]
MQRYDRLKEILRLDPERDFLAIYRLTATYEFPWDHARALELAFLRIYAVPGIGALLAETAASTDRTQKRYDDTVLLLDAVLEHGFDSDTARIAIRRVNGTLRGYDLSHDEMRYVLSTFVVVPKRWLDAYGWRSLTHHELRACARYYATLGRHLGITDIPDSYEEFEATLNAYEEAHFGWDEGGRKVADASLALMASWYPAPLAPLVRGGALALLDDPLLGALRYEPPHPRVRGLVRGALRLRGRAVRLLAPRAEPHYARQNPEIKSYPGGYDVGELGTFPAPGAGGSPVPRPRRPRGADAQPPL